MEVIKGGTCKRIRIVASTVGQTARNGIGGGHHQGILSVDGVAGRSSSVVPVRTTKLRLANTVTSLARSANVPEFLR